MGRLKNPRLVPDTARDSGPRPPEQSRGWKGCSIQPNGQEKSGTGEKLTTRPIKLIEKTAFGEMRRVGLLPAAEHFIDGDQFRDGKLRGVFLRD